MKGSKTSQPLGALNHLVAGEVLESLIVGLSARPTNLKYLNIPLRVTTNPESGENQTIL